jgi:hypothetical protein
MSSKGEKKPLLLAFNQQSQRASFRVKNFEKQLRVQSKLYVNSSVFHFQESEYKAVPTSQQPELRKNGTDEVLTVSSSFSSQPVTYSWENITVFHETTPGNCLTRLCKKSPPIQKKILDDGEHCQNSQLTIRRTYNKSCH